MMCQCTAQKNIPKEKSQTASFVRETNHQLQVTGNELSQMRNIENVVDFRMIASVKSG